MPTNEPRSSNPRGTGARPAAAAPPAPVAVAHAQSGRGERGHSYSKDRSQLLRRLSRLEGQVRGISRMIERDEYCIDILQQTAALRAAVDAISLLVMEDHVAGCLATAVRTGDAEAYTDEVMEVVRRSMGRPVRSPRPTSD